MGVEGRRMKKMRRIVVLGATGSIGQSAQKVARHLPDQMQIVGLSAHQNTEALLLAAQEFHPVAICIGKKTSLSDFTKLQGKTRVLEGAEGLIELATMPEADLVLIAIVGTAGLAPALAAIEAGKDIAVASKEILVMAGGIVMQAASRKGVRVLPVDSEHNAIFQCLEGKSAGHVQRLVLTCSGGPFREMPASEFGKITPEMALRHPTWQMGRKITIDSATLFNKGLEMIEAHWLFGVAMDRVEAIIHPQSIVHSMVEFIDGSVLAQMSHTDMTFPIQYAITYPDRVVGALAPLDFSKLGSLDFFAPRSADFPALNLAVEAGTRGGTLPAVLNAANEVAVEAFLQGNLSFPRIWQTVEKTMSQISFVAQPSLEEILAADSEARQCARLFCAYNE